MYTRPDGSQFNLIVFEGVECSGKSSQIELLQPLLKDTEYFHEPGATVYGSELRPVILSNPNVNPISQLLTFNAARAELVKHIFSNTAAKLIVLDRFYHSTEAYQGGGHRLPITLVNRVNRMGTDINTIFGYSAVDQFYLVPDLVLLLDISLETMKQRLAARETGNGFDNFDDEFYKRVIDGYHTLAHYDPTFVRIDGERSPNEIHNEIMGHIINVH